MRNLSNVIIGLGLALYVGGFIRLLQVAVRWWERRKEQR